MLDKKELIGCIIDTFEDDLHNRAIIEKGFANKIKLHKEDNDCDGVFYGGIHYDNVAEKLETLFKEWRII